MPVFGGEGGGGELLLPKVGTWGGFFVLGRALGLLAGFNIHYLCFYFPLLPFT